MISALLEPRNATLLIVLAIGVVVLGIGGIFALVLIKWFIPGIMILMAVAIYAGLGPFNAIPIAWRLLLTAILFGASWWYIDHDGFQLAMLEALGAARMLLGMLGVA